MSKKKQYTKRLNLWLTQHQKRELKKIAVADNVDVADAARVAIDSYLMSRKEDSFVPQYQGKVVR